MIMNGEPFNVGELKTSITLEISTLVTDEGGAQKAVYIPMDDVWAKWVNAHGPESVASGAMQAAKRATVTIRYRADITAGWAVVKDGARYQVIAPPDDIRERHEYLELQVQQLVGSV